MKKKKTPCMMKFVDDEESKSDLYFFYTWLSKRKLDDELECPSVKVSCSTQPPDVYPSQLPGEGGVLDVGVHICVDANGMILWTGMLEVEP